MQPDSLESKFRLLATIPFDRRIGRKHSAVLAFIIDWHHRKYGDALASVRHIVAQLKERDPFGQGFYTGDVHSALTDLVEWGYLAQQKGSGRRASRYTPNWTIFDSVRESQNTTEDEISVRESQNASVRESPNTTSDSVRESPNKDPLTPTRVLDPGTGVEGTTCPAPATDGLAATVGGAGEDKFETLWRAYGYRREKAKAKAEFAKLDPTPEGMAMLIASATAWREAWAAQGKADAPRKHLHVWLRDECWDEDPPTAFRPKERAQRPPAEAHDIAPANDNDRHACHRAPARIPLGRHRAVIVASQVDKEGAETTASLHVEVAGTAFTLGVAIESRFIGHQTEGQDMLGNLVRALGLSGVGDTAELHDIPFELEVRAFGNLDFHPIAADAAEVTHA